VVYFSVILLLESSCFSLLLHVFILIMEFLPMVGQKVIVPLKTVPLYCEKICVFLPIYLNVPTHVWWKDECSSLVRLPLYSKYIHLPMIGVKMFVPLLLFFPFIQCIRLPMLGGKMCLPLLLDFPFIYSSSHGWWKDVCSLLAEFLRVSNILSLLCTRVGWYWN
jgi:hypothetical protein